VEEKVGEEKVASTKFSVEEKVASAKFGENTCDQAIY
jgi:hypothetical protein